MTNGLVLPLWAEILVALLLVTGSLLTLIGCLGLCRLRTFYQRMHSPTLGATMGMVCIVLASMLYFSATGEGLALHEVLIAILLTMVIPSTTVMLTRAALYRQRRFDGQPATPPGASGTPDGAAAKRPDAG